MTVTPDPYDPEDPNREDRLGGRIDFDAVYEPVNYAGRRTGRGRWFPLFAAGDPLGYVWTNDADGLGFMATTDAGRVRTAELVAAFQVAAGLGTPATVVFDHWAGLGSLGLAAGPVAEGDLDTLDDLD